MTFRASLYTYPWDLEAKGYRQGAQAIAAMGFDSVSLACSYHTAKFLLPHGPERKVFINEGAAATFRITPPCMARFSPGHRTGSGRGQTR